MTGRAVAIWESGTAESWTVEGLNGYRLSATVATAADALRLVELEDERAAIIGRRRREVITAVTWHTRTGIGKTAVNAIREKADR